MRKLFKFMALVLGVYLTMKLVELLLVIVTLVIAITGS